MDGDKCMRCGEVGEDRRTLWMSCFYAMEELGIPFETEVLFAADLADCTPAKAPVSIDLPGPGKKKINLQSGTVTCTGELKPRVLYTLRVCKDCRAEWLTCIADWFVCQKRIDNTTGTGVFLRKHGATVEATPAEVAAMRESGREPVRVGKRCSHKDDDTDGLCDLLEGHVGPHVGGSK